MQSCSLHLQLATHIKFNILRRLQNLPKLFDVMYLLCQINWDIFFQIFLAFLLFKQIRDENFRLAFKKNDILDRPGKSSQSKCSLSCFLLVKLRHSEKATKIDNNLPLVLTLLSKCQKKWEIFFKFCALLRKPQL